MEIRQLYYVLEVAKCNSFSKAANAQFITQPAISQQISALEEELQVKLFKRDTHSVVLTKEGEKFCAYAKEKGCFLTGTEDIHIENINVVGEH